MHDTLTFTAAVAPWASLPAPPLPSTPSGAVLLVLASSPSPSSSSSGSMALKVLCILENLDMSCLRFAPARFLRRRFSVSPVDGAEDACRQIEITGKQPQKKKVAEVNGTTAQGHIAVKTPEASEPAASKQVTK